MKRISTSLDHLNTGAATVDWGDGQTSTIPFGYVTGGGGGTPGPTGPQGPAGADGASDSVVAGYIASSSLTQTNGDARWVKLSGLNALGDARWVKKSVLSFDLSDYATPSTTVDQSTGIQACFDAANAAGGKVTGTGTYRIESGLTLLCAADLNEVTLNYYGTGTALTVGADTSGTVTQRRQFHLPKVVFSGGGNWDGTSVGVKLVNLNTCDVYVPYVQDFEQGVLCYGNGSGFAYNTITLGHLAQNHKQLTLTNAATGYCNQNTFLGGRLDTVSAKGATANDANAYMVLFQQNGASGGPNNNTFTGTSFEGGNYMAQRLIFDNAKFNSFLNCRFECLSGATTFPIQYRNTSTDNRIVGGYDSWRIVETFDSTSSGGVLMDDTTGMSGGLSTAQVIPTATFTDITAWNPGAAFRASYDSATGLFTPRRGRWLITANVTYAANTTGLRRLVLVLTGFGTRKFIEMPAAATGKTTVTVSETFRFTAAVPSFSFQAYQTSGADLALDTATGTTRISLEYLGG